MRTVLHGKIHRATVTEANLEYEGSITIDPDLIEAANFLTYEQVHVLDITNGNRLETYIIEGRRGSGEICINGAAAHLVNEGDKVIIVSYQSLPEAEAREVEPYIVLVNDRNEIAQVKRSEGAATYPHVPVGAGIV